MGSDIIVNVAREETRVAVLDRKILTDLYIDRAKQRDFVGNVYKGKVVKVLPGLQAAFIDIGQDKAAFIEKTGADTLVATDAGCLMNIAGCLRRRGSRVQALHLAQVLEKTSAP